MSLRQNDEKYSTFLKTCLQQCPYKTEILSCSVQLTKFFHTLTKLVKEEFRWVPCHSKIREIEEADVEVRTTLQDQSQETTQPCYILP